MKVKFMCQLYPNIAVGSTQFNDGYCEVDSIFTDKITELMACPFVTCVTNYNMSNVNTEQEEVPLSTFKNRLSRKNKTQVLEIAAGLGLTDIPAEADKSFIVDKVLNFKYPNGE